MEAAARVLEARGAILEGVIEPALVEQLTSAIDRCMEALAVPFGPNDFLGTRTRRLFNLLAGRRGRQHERRITATRDAIRGHVHLQVALKSDPGQWVAKAPAARFHRIPHALCILRVSRTSSARRRQAIE